MKGGTHANTRAAVAKWKDPRKAIRDRLAELKDAAGEPRTLYWLAQELKRKKIMHPQTLYTYMRGEKDTKADTLFEILQLLGITLTDE